MSYSVKEIFYSLQGEGANTGRPAVFLRFAGCNLWSGLEKDRATAICGFCDTDFVGTNGRGGGRFPTAVDMVRAVARKWPVTGTPAVRPLVVCTGGEPLLQLDEEAVEALHAAEFEVAIETNGTLPCPGGVDWICLSPKAGTELVLRSGDELKLVFPQPGVEPDRFESLDFRYFFLQPMDGPNRERNTRLALSYCLEHPRWRLSIQTQKLLGIA